MDGSPQRWWQWVLMYPTIVVALAGALAGAIPQYYQWISAAALGLPIFGNVGDAQQQERTWERNVGCLRGIDHIKPTSSTNYSIDLVSCPTGDILVTLTPLQNPDQQVSRWIITKVLFTQVADAAPARLELAQAAGTPAGSPDTERVLDIKKQGANVVRRVQRSDNTCVDETIDAYTGRRLEQKPAPCAKF
jgi:hypothetical protein